MDVEGSREGDTDVSDTFAITVVREVYVRGGGIVRFALLGG